MKRDDLVRAATPEALVDHLRQVDADAPPAGHDRGGDHGGGDHGDAESVREATHRGHRIVVRTTYRIEVDGQPIEGHLGVTNDGRVHYHAIPNYSFTSAVDLVKQLIDSFPDDFPPPAAPHSHGEEE